MIKPIILSVMALALSAMCTFAQSIPDMTVSKDFSAQVKSIDEFIQRFNGTENNPNLRNTNSRSNNLIALFDYKMNHEGMADSTFRKHIEEFVKAVDKNGYTIKLTDAEMYAIADINATIMSKPVNMTMILQSQTYNKDRTRWAIVGVCGLKRSGIIDTLHYYGISPVDHETHFMSIEDIFGHNYKEIVGYRGKDISLDELSFFFALAMAGKVKINNVANLTMHCLEIPGYIFTINEMARSGTNSGWLITRLMKKNDKEKKLYLNTILNR